MVLVEHIFILYILLEMRHHKYECILKFDQWGCSFSSNYIQNFCYIEKVFVFHFLKSIILFYLCRQVWFENEFRLISLERTKSVGKWWIMYKKLYLSVTSSTHYLQIRIKHRQNDKARWIASSVIICHIVRPILHRCFTKTVLWVIHQGVISSMSTKEMFAGTIHIRLLLRTIHHWIVDIHASEIKHVKKIELATIYVHFIFIIHTVFIAQQEKGQARYTLFANNDEKGTNGRNLCKMWIVRRVWFVGFISVSQKFFLQNAFAGVDGFLMNWQKFFRCIFSCYIHSQKLRSTMNSVLTSFHHVSQNSIFFTKK